MRSAWHLHRAWPEAELSSCPMPATRPSNRASRRHCARPRTGLPGAARLAEHVQGAEPMRTIPLTALLLLALPALAAAPPPPQPPAPPTFTSDQVTAGSQVYARFCAACHGATQEGGEAGPALRGRGLPCRKWCPQAVAGTVRADPAHDAGHAARAACRARSMKTWLRCCYPQMARRPAPPGCRPATLRPSRAPDPPAPDTEWLHHRGDAGQPELFAAGADQSRQRRAAHRGLALALRQLRPQHLSEPGSHAADGAWRAVCHRRRSRSVVAIDARTGETLWMYRLDEGARGEYAPRKGPGRGACAVARRARPRCS